MEFNIGDKIKHSCGSVGTIVDTMTSNKTGKCYYRIQFDDRAKADSCLYKEEELSLLEEQIEYTYEFEYLENLVTARLYEIADGKKTEIGIGHGHIFHKGVYGVAQAASYALKRICDDLNGGSLKAFKNN
jgi:hypothetical protein